LRGGILTCGLMTGKVKEQPHRVTPGPQSPWSSPFLLYWLKLVGRPTRTRTGSWDDKQRARRRCLKNSFSQLPCSPHQLPFVFELDWILSFFLAVVECLSPDQIRYRAGGQCCACPSTNH